MARHGKKPSEEGTSSHTPRTLAGSATTNTSADSTDAAASGIAVNSSTVSSAFASDADGNTGNTLVGNASNEVKATEVETNATSTNATGERTISSSNTAEISNRQSHESSESSESRQPQDLFDAAIAQGISDGDAWTDQRVKHIYRQIIIAVVVVVVVLGAVFGFTGVRASQQMRDLAALNDCKEAVTAMNTSYSKAFQLKAKISEAFTSFDGSYDLDKLAELHQTEVTAPKTLSCAADTSATISKANAAKAEYDKQAKQFKQALQKSDESAATDGGDGTDNSADGTAGDDGTDEATDTEGDAGVAGDAGARTAPSTNPAQPTRPTQRWTINSSSKSTNRNAANQPADQAGQSSQPGLSTKPVISLTIFTFLPTLPYPFSAYPTFLLILESKEKQKRVTWQAKEETLKFRHFQDFTAIKCSNKSKEKCKTRERPNERKGGSHELDSGKWSRDHR